MLATCERPTRKRRQVPTSMSRMGVGKTFADKDRPNRWYVCLPVDGVWSFVWWEGRFYTVLPNEVRVEPYAFSIYQHVTRWGVSIREVDRFIEDRFYKWDPDVKNVRATRDPLNNKTIWHAPIRHKVHPGRGVVP